MPRAFRVEKQGLLAGYLADEAGPFVFAADAAGVYPSLHHLRFTSLTEELEDEVGQILERDLAFEIARAELEAAGFRLTGINYEQVFLPANQAPLHGPGARYSVGDSE